MNEIKKQVLLVGVNDISTIPSGGDTRRDCMDFRLLYEKLGEIKDMDAVCVVLLADDKDRHLWATTEEYEWMLEAMSYAICSYTGCATIKALGEDIEQSLIQGTDILERGEAFHDKTKWLLLGHKELADKYNIGYVQWS